MEKKRIRAVPWGRLLVLTAGLALLGQACQKEPFTDSFKASPKGNDLEVESRIMRFIEFAAAMPTTGNEKSGSETMDPEEAIWLIEGSLNYAYVNPLDKGSMLAVDSIIVSINKTGSKISEAEAARVFMEIFDSLFIQANMIGNTQKTLDMLDIRIANELGSEMDLEIAYSFSETSYPLSISQPYGPEDWWWFGFGMGKCSAYSGWFGKDAATEITTKIKFNLSQPVNHSFYTDLSTKFVRISDLQPLPPGTDPNYFAYPLFFNTNTPPWSGSFHYCISPLEMDFYFNGSYNLLNTYKPLKDSTDPALGYKSVVYALIIPSENMTPTGDIQIQHSLVAVYGISHSSVNWQPYYW